MLRKTVPGTGHPLTEEVFPEVETGSVEGYLETVWVGEDHASCLRDGRTDVGHVNLLYRIVSWADSDVLLSCQNLVALGEIRITQKTESCTYGDVLWLRVNKRISLLTQSEGKDS